MWCTFAIIIVLVCRSGAIFGILIIPTIRVNSLHKFPTCNRNSWPWWHVNKDSPSRAAYLSRAVQILGVWYPPASLLRVRPFSRLRHGPRWVTSYPGQLVRFRSSALGTGQGPRKNRSPTARKREKPERSKRGGRVRNMSLSLRVWQRCK